jgi:hypothetical protein
LTKVLSEFGGLRRSTNIGREAKANSTNLESGGWQANAEVLEKVRCQGAPKTGH